MRNDNRLFIQNTFQIIVIFIISVFPHHFSPLNISQLPLHHCKINRSQNAVAVQIAGFPV